jgi:DNA invertase Pin-like site-specific DNA recombinase
MMNSGNAFQKPQHAAGYVRISRDPYGQEKGVTRQMEDIKELAARLGWTIIRFYVENDTSAYKKRKITLPDGSTAWRVIRPEFTRMLQDLQGGEIDGIIVYDLDRLARQPRDLEDLIDLVEAYRRPVQGVTGNIDLMTSNGRAMARVLTAMANKSSEDTARRVARARLQEANEGRTHKTRRFGRTIEGELIPEEAEVLQWAARRLIDGESWTGTAKILAAGEIQPPGGRWYVQALRYMLLNPTVAGIAVYNGAMREHNGTGTTVESYITSALKNPDGSYVMTTLDKILTVEEWETLVTVFRAGREGKQFTGVNTKKYLLSGLLRCGKAREDGTVCNHPMNGTRITDPKHAGEKIVIYRCPGPAQGGCAGVSRRAALVDKLIEDTLFGYLAKKAPREAPEPEQAAAASDEQRQLDAANARLAKLRTGYATGQVTDETFFATVPLIEAEIKKLTKAAKEAAHARPGYAPMRTVAQVRKAWDEADTAGKRAILGQYLNAIVVKPTAHGRAAFDHSAIVPKWKKIPTA